MIQFDKKLIGNLDMNSTKIYYKMVKNYKKKYKFSIQLQHNFNMTSIQIQGVLFNQCIKLLSFYYIRRSIT